MRVLVIGSGAREHALAARLRAEPQVSDLIAAPGHPGISAVARTIPASQTDVDALLSLAVREQVELTIVGPEAPLSLGLADRFIEAGLLIVGPLAGAAPLEASKAVA